MLRKLAIDWEFSEVPNSTKIHEISLGMCDDQGEKFYAIFDGDHSRYSDKWLQDNVVAKLDANMPWLPREQIRRDALDFIFKDGVPDKIEFWSDQDSGGDQYLLTRLLSKDGLFFIKDFKDQGVKRIEFPSVWSYYTQLGRPEPRRDWLTHVPENEAHIAVNDAAGTMANVLRLDDLSEEISQGQARGHTAFAQWTASQLGFAPAPRNNRQQTFNFSSEALPSPFQR